MIVEHNGRKWWPKPMCKYSSPKHTNKGGHMLITFTDSEDKDRTIVRCMKCFDKPLDPNLPSHKTKIKQVVPLNISNAKIHLRPLQLSYKCNDCDQHIMVP
jgi:hypothetical protein